MSAACNRTADTSRKSDVKLKFERVRKILKFIQLVDTLRKVDVKLKHNSEYRKKQRFDTQQRRLQITTMRRSGMTYQAIGDALGISRAAAHKHVKQIVAEAIKKTDENVEFLRHIHRERLERLLLSAWPGALKGDAKKFDQALKLLDAEARFDGLNLPEKYAPTDPTGETPYDPITDNERASRIATILDEARARRDREAVVCAAERGAGSD